MIEIIYFIGFVLFLLCQYAIIIVSMYIADWVGATGRTYWCFVVVLFLLLNEFCFRGFVNETELITDQEDEEEIWE